MTNKFEKLSEYLHQLIPFWITSIDIHENNIQIKVHSKNINNILNFLKIHANTKMESLMDIFSVDELKEPRFSIHYQLLSIHFNLRLEVVTFPSNNHLVPSATPIFNSSNWLEREIWDMMGIFFFDHPDLRRILTDYGFNGFPLRKDFPISGYEEIRYDDERRRIVVEPIQLSQEFRDFTFPNPWNKYLANVSKPKQNP